MTYLMTPNGGLKVDFGAQKAGRDWYIINDGVMGGLSSGKAMLTENSLVFKGSVSLANNGGFTSFKCPFQKIDLSAYEKVSIRIRGQGQTLGLTLEMDQRWFMPYYKLPIPLQSKEWQTITLYLKDFKGYRVGQFNGNYLSKDEQAKIIRMGFITDDKKEGNFEIEIDYVLFE